MSELEATVKPWILESTSKTDLHRLQDPLKHCVFSRWALKTACVIDHVLATREIPKQIFRDLFDCKESLGSGIYVLVGWHPFEHKSLFCLNRRNWWSTFPFTRTFQEATFHDWFKVAFSIEHVLVLVAGIPDQRFHPVIGTGVHIPVWPNRKIELHHWYHSMRLEGLAPNAALEKFSDLFAASFEGQMF